MSAVFVAPLGLTKTSANEQATAPSQNALVDPVGLVWRSNGLSGIQGTFNVAGSFDSIALTGTNLRANDTVRVRVAANSGMSNPSVDRTIAAWSGLPGVSGAITYLPFEASVTGPYVRIDISSTTNPDQFVQVERMIVGKRIECQGIDHGASQAFEDSSVVEELASGTAIDRYRVRDSWKFTVSDTTQDSYARQWYPFLKQVGKHDAFLFIPDTASPYLQTQACLARMTGTAKGDSQCSDFWKLDLNLISV